MQEGTKPSPAPAPSAPDLAALRQAATATALRPLPPAATLLLVLQGERLELERERLELERLRLTAAAATAAAAGEASLGAAGVREAPQGSARRPAAKGTPRPPGRRPARSGLALAGMGALAALLIAVMIGFAMGPTTGSDWFGDLGQGAGAEGGEEPEPRSTPGDEGQDGAADTDPALRNALAQVVSEVERLPRRPPAERGSQIHLLRKTIDGLRRSGLQGPLSARLEDAARELEDVARELADEVAAAAEARLADASGAVAEGAGSDPAPREGSEPSGGEAAEAADAAEAAEEDDDEIDRWLAEGGWEGGADLGTADERPAGERPADEQPGGAQDPAGAGGAAAGQEGVEERPARPEASSFEANRLLFEACRAHVEDEREALDAALAALERLGPDLPETHGAHGLVLFRDHAFPEAYEALSRAGAHGGVVVAREHVRAAFFTKRYPEARAGIDALPADEQREWRVLIEGPFRRRHPQAAEVLETISPEGNYRVMTDLGLASNFLPVLERRLSEADPVDRPRLLAAARRSHRGLTELADIMDKAHRAYGRLLSSEGRKEVYPTVYVFAERADFESFSASLRIGDTESTLGYYLPYYRAMVFYDQRDGAAAGKLLSDGTQEVLLHETFHQWIHLYIEGAPHWFNEGLAEYFGISEITRAGLRYGQIPRGSPSRLENIRDALAGRYGVRPLPLPSLLRADRRTFMNPTRAAINYAHAWSFVHYLGSSRGGQRLLRDYFHALRAGLDREEAYWKVFGELDMASIEQEWTDYVARLR